MDYAEESFLEAWRGASTNPSTIEALTGGGGALVRAARDFEQLGAVVEEPRSEVARLGGSVATPMSVMVDRALNDVRDVRILATVECGRCGGEGQMNDPEGFGWKEILAAGATDTLQARVRARVEELGLDREPPPEGRPCPDCDGRRIEVSLSAVEYAAALRQQDASERRAPVTVLRLTANHPALHEALSRPQERPRAARQHDRRVGARGRAATAASRVAARPPRDPRPVRPRRQAPHGGCALIEDAQSRSTLPHDALHPSREPEL